ncbi:tetraacyldisaccharide 4'-kinase [Desulfocurvibacter africanus]|uniref:tetraacyldisaccharide 4'-kinase n=2 Tax=Desulfocurvibacter africanus TaxID=873 RepID=UPI0003F57D09|nr:tetraacyldisaccharide 4'-kinase [Desulfocurvibacter africanus]
MSSLPLLQKALSPILWPLGKAYALAMRLRERSWLKGSDRWRPPAPCISVGNISMGGSGKTPLCDWLLGWATDRGLTPVVLTRGYKAKPLHLPYVVEPSNSPDQAGDEPLLLAQAHPGARVVVDPVRVRSGAYAWERYHPDLFVLDDGFQHLAVQRDLDLVLLHPDDLTTGWNRVFPAGMWREGKAALGRASAFCIKVSSPAFAMLRPAIEQHLAELGKPVFPFEIKPQAVVSLTGGERFADLGGRPYLLATGVGAPSQVADTATAYLGHAPAEVMAFPDHHAFTAADVQRMLERARAQSCPRVLVTPKDAVKLRNLATPEFVTFELSLAFGLGLFSTQTLPQFIEHFWNSRQSGVNELEKPATN